MEYLTRSLKYAAAKFNFQYRPLCKQVKLASLMFADDVLLFSRGDTESMMLLLKSFSTFSRASGLKVSASKSNAYFKGVPENIKQDILRVSGFAEGTLPFKYLGMPIQTTRLKKKDCECLVEKICSRINGYGARKFSYEGQVVWCEAVLSSLHSYWASMFVLPKGIINRIEATCRNFLWDSSAEYRRVPLVAWDKICRPKEEGGLGLKNQESMNKAMVGRLVNWVAEKKDTIWVKWVQQNYLKGQDWMDYTPAAQSSWVWRRICRVKQEFLPCYTDGQWNLQGKGYTAAACYDWLQGTVPKVPWASLIWNGWVLHKHQFHAWLYAQGALRTNDKLVKFGMDIDATCFLCAQDSEGAEHLFFECIYSKQVIGCINQSLKCHIPDRQVLDWCMLRNGTKVRKGVQAATVWGAMYHIWQERNKCRLEGVLVRPERCAEKVIEDVKARIRGRDFQHVTKEDIAWLKHKNYM
ncbi:uncharacterized protein LOC141588533 [Silene latifolia]|uniref:uncharacterized protein LOC141588533 n=1 Tax=Silene latifolia TaxID=37657 RepID=UPI003D76E772